jgi:hypothetical protein
MINILFVVRLSHTYKKYGFYNVYMWGSYLNDKVNVECRCMYCGEK